MKDVRDLESVRRPLEWVCIVLDTNGHTHLFNRCSEILECIQDYDFFDDLAHDVRYGAVVATCCLADSLKYWLGRPDVDEYYDRNLKIMKSISIFL